MHLLVTRPESETAAFRAQLEALGHTVTADPLLRIEYLPIATDALEGSGGLIATSRNGLRAIAASPAIDTARRLPLIAVGTGTAQLAADLGFTEVITGPGTGAELVPLIVEKCRDRSAPMTHIRGESVAFDLKTALQERDIPLRELVAYRGASADALAPETRDLLLAGKIDAVILMSPRTAGIFAQLATEAGLREEARRLAFLCLSPAVAAATEPLSPTRVEIAKSPNLEGMLSAVTRVATLWSGV